MSAPFIWIFFPILLGGVCYVLRGYENWGKSAGFSVAVILAALSVILPADLSTPIRLGLGLPPFIINESIPILSARLEITQDTRPVILILYLILSIWFGCSLTLKGNRMLVPIGLGAAGWLIAALSITPSLYAQLLVGMVVLLCIPLLSEPGQALNKGLRQYLVFQIFGMGLILLANWTILFSTVQGFGLIDQKLPLIVLAIGYALVLPVFPFHSWLPAIAGSSKPFGSQLVFFMIPTSHLLLLFERFQQIDLAGVEINIIQVVKMIAVLMIGGAGFWAISEKNLKRLTGFMITQQIGNSLVALCLHLEGQSGATVAGLFKAQFLPYGIALAICAYSLAIFQKNQVGMSQNETKGIFQTYPIATIGVFLGIYSISGFPPMAGFSTQYMIWSGTDQLPQAFPIIALLGRVCLGLSGLRFFANSLDFDRTKKTEIRESKGQVIILLFGIIFLFLAGLFSSAFLNILVQYFNMPANPFVG